MRLRNKISFLVSASVLALGPCLAMKASADEDRHALTGIADAHMEDGYQSAASPTSAGTSYAGIGYGDQFLTDPITLYKVPNFDFGYHKRSEDKTKFSLIESKSNNRVLEVIDQNGQLNWNVSASLGSSIVENSSIPSEAVSITLNPSNTSISSNGVSSTSEDPGTAGLKVASGNINYGKKPTIWFSRNLTDAGAGKRIPRYAILSFNNIDSVQLQLDQDAQPYKADKYVAPITWTLNVTI